MNGIKLLQNFLYKLFGPKEDASLLELKQVKKTKDKKEFNVQIDTFTPELLRFFKERDNFKDVQVGDTVTYLLDIEEMDKAITGLTKILDLLILAKANFKITRTSMKNLIIVHRQLKEVCEKLEEIVPVLFETIIERRPEEDV